MGSKHLAANSWVSQAGPMGVAYIDECTQNPHQQLS